MLKSIKLPDSLKSIGNEAFRDSGLASIDVPPDSSLKSIGDNAFNSCHRHPSIKLPDSLEFIGEGAYETRSESNQSRCQILLNSLKNSLPLFAGALHQLNYQIILNPSERLISLVVPVLQRSRFQVLSGTLEMMPSWKVRKLSSRQYYSLNLFSSIPCQL